MLSTLERFAAKIEDQGSKADRMAKVINNQVENMFHNSSNESNQGTLKLLEAKK
jgi:hypothetical protein